jgi:hypothetical protein
LKRGRWKACWRMRMRMRKRKMGCYGDDGFIDLKSASFIV